MLQKETTLRADASVHASHTPDERATPEAEPCLAELIAELTLAGLIGVEVEDDGDISYCLTARGQRTARMMAMSRQSHALVLLGALVASGGKLN